MGRKKFKDMTPLAQKRTLNRRDFTMKEAASKMEIDTKTLWRYENGVSDVPARIIEKMSFFYGVSREVILQAILDTAKILQDKCEQKIRRAAQESATGEE